MRMKDLRKKSSLFIVLAIVLMVSACSSNNTNTKTESTDSVKPVESAQPSTEAEAAKYPLKSDVTLTHWAQLNPGLNTLKTSYQDTPLNQDLQEATGVKLAYTNPAIGQEKEAFNVLLASGDLPDIIEWDWLNLFPGGPEKALNDGYIMNLNDAIDKWAPNLKKYLAEHPEVDKQVKTDSGNYYAFPFIRGHDSLRVYQGPMLRKDWLDELGLPVPTTIDEWYTTLKAFKEKKGATAPLSLTSATFDAGAFVGAYGVVPGFYLDNGVVKYGSIQPQYKEYITTLRKWYEEGLFDNNFATLDGKTLDANILNGATGATVHNSGGGMGKWLPLLQANDPKADLIAAPYPVLNKGDKPKFGQKDFAYSSVNASAISAKSKNLELAVKFLDYGYSDEGHMLMNFGKPGISYNLVDGYPQYSDLMLKNPDKLGIAQTISLYTRASWNGPSVQDVRYIEQYLVYPQQKEAVKMWQTDVDTYKLPPITPNQQESAEYAAIMADVNTLSKQMLEKIILGAEPVSEFDNYVAKFKSVKIDRAIEIQQAALDRFNKR